MRPPHPTLETPLTRLHRAWAGLQPPTPRPVYPGAGGQSAHGATRVRCGAHTHAHAHASHNAHHTRACTHYTPHMHVPHTCTLTPHTQHNTHMHTPHTQYTPHMHTQCTPHTHTIHTTHAHTHHTHAHTLHTTHTAPHCTPHTHTQYTPHMHVPHTHVHTHHTLTHHSAPHPYHTQHTTHTHIIHSTHPRTTCTHTHHRRILYTRTHHPSRADGNSAVLGSRLRSSVIRARRSLSWEALGTPGARGRRARAVCPDDSDWTGGRACVLGTCAFEKQRPGHCRSSLSISAPPSPAQERGPELRCRPRPSSPDAGAAAPPAPEPRGAERALSASSPRNVTLVTEAALWAA